MRDFPSTMASTGGSGGPQQVWQLTQFFPLCKKIIDMPGGQINDPLSGRHYSLPFLPATPSSPSRNLEGLFELTRRPSRALDSPRGLLPELQRYKDTVRCAALGAEVPGHRQQLTQTLIVRLMQTHFLYRSLIVKSQQNLLELVTRPVLDQ